MTTGPEIWAQMDGEIDAFVAGIGTGGTITGVGRYLKEQDPNIRIIGVEPKGSPVISGGEAGDHKIQGIGAGFVPQIFDRHICDDIMLVSDIDAYSGMEALNFRDFGCAGISSGAAYSAAVRYTKKNKRDTRVVILCADGADRYK